MSKDNKCYIFTLTPELEKLVETVSLHIENGVEGLFNKAIILMSIAIKAKKQNHKLAIIDEDNKIIDTIEM